MASIMDRDPWSWSISDVTNFFVQHHADKAVAGMPGASLPPPEMLTANFTQEGITGAVLLCAVDHDFVRRHLKIKALGHRAAVIYCIEKLRALSTAYRLRNEPTVWAAPTPAAQDEPLQLNEEQIARLLELPDPVGRLQQLLAAKALPALAAAPAEETGESMQLDDMELTTANETDPGTNANANTRPNETLTESKDGKKRRRLNLSSVSKEKVVTDTQPFEADDVERFLPSRKVPIDDIFFGDTAIGRECGPMIVDHPLYVHEGSNNKEIDDQTFQYVNPDLHPGVSGYVSSALQRFMRNEDEFTITRHQRHAVVIYPYRVGMQAQRTTEAPRYDRRGRISFGGMRSAMVIQQQQHAVPAPLAGAESDELAYVAIRENEALVESGAGDKGYNQEQAAELAGEHDHLLLRYPDNEGDLMSDGDDEETIVGDGDNSTEFGDDQAEVEDDEEVVPNSDVKDIIGRSIEAYIVGWQQDQLPKLEMKRAWTVWKQTKRSKYQRDQLVQGARTRIQELETRLLKARADLGRSLWENKASLDTVCAAIQPTVVDIQHELWNIDVWNRRREPDRDPTRKTNKHVAKASKQAQASTSNLLSQIPLDDRLSVEPRQPSPPTIPLDNDVREPEAEPEADAFHPPRGSPVPEQEHSPFVVPDDDKMDVDKSSPQATGSADDDDHDAEMGGTSPTSGQRALSVKDIPTTPGSHSRPVSTNTLPSATVFQAMTSADMPSPSVLAQMNQNKPSPTPSLIGVTDLRSSPREPLVSVRPKAKQPRKGRGAARNNAASISVADNWTYAKLELNQDRSKLLIKLIRDMGPAKRNALWRTFQELMLKKFIIRLEAALDSITLREATPPADGSLLPDDNPKAQIMKHCARLLLAFHFARSDICREDEKLPDDLVPRITQNLPQDHDIRNFVHLLCYHLRGKEQPLFSSPVPVTYDEPILIESDDDPHEQNIASEDLKYERPESAKKRRKVDVDERAANKRRAARARMEESQNQQSSNPSALQTMVFANHDPGDKVINPSRKPGQDCIFIESKIAEKMKSYQLEGAQFLWRELTGDIDGAQGCLLAHTMGLGKTMQSIALLCAVDVASQSPSVNITRQLPKDLRLGSEDRHRRSLRFLIICPSSLIQNWHRELEHWAHPNAFGGNIICIDSTASGSGYIRKLQQWSKRGGILLIGYVLFARLVGRQDKEVPEDLPVTDHVAAGDAAKNELYNANAETVRNILTQDAELVVADEAHQVKNPKSGTAIAVSKIRSTARIALTGTPMSNDVDEIYSIISWVTPGFLGDSKQFSYFYGIPIKEGLYIDSSSYEKRVSTIKLKSLHYEIEPKVHRAGIEVLKGELKPKVEFVLTVELTQQQHDAYAGTVAALLGTDRDLSKTSNTTIFAWLGVLGLLTAHPSCFREKLLKPKAPSKPKKKANAAQAHDEDAEIGEVSEESPIPGDEDVFALGFTQSVVDALIEGLTDSIDPALSAKSRLLQQILRLSKKEKDKVLIFSASQSTLDYLGELLGEDGIRFHRIDGKVPMKERTKMLAEFQDEKGGLDAMLISTRAGGQGLNIQSANRVVIFDFGFNPAWEEQAIGRAYRFGQEKPVFVYRFVAGDTYESNIYNTQMFKTSLASRVVDKRNPHRNANRNTKKYLYPPKHVKHEDLTNELELDLDPKVLSKIMKAQIERGDARDPSIDICTVRTMEVLQAEAADAPLDEAELKQVEENKAAWKANKVSGFRAAMPAEQQAMYANAAGVPSTAPAPGAANGPLRTNSMAASTQAPPRYFPFTQQQQPLLDRPQQTSSSFGARDIRNGSNVGPVRGSGPSLGGLPFSKRDD